MLDDIWFFVITFAASAATPGPDVVAIFSRSLSNGAVSTVPFTIGIIVGKLVLLTVAVMGLSTVAQQSEGLFTVIRVLGGIYLVSLGTKKYFSRSLPPSLVSSRIEIKDLWTECVGGFLIASSNPYAIFFYLSILPSVISVSSLTIAVYLILCASIAVIMSLIAMFYAFFGAKAGSLLHSVKAYRTSNKVSGIIMILVGIFVVFR